MLDIDIHDYARRIECVKNLVKNSKISERNKQLITEFMGDCRTGWGGKKLTDARVSKLIGALKFSQKCLKRTGNG